MCQLQMQLKSKYDKPKCAMNSSNNNVLAMPTSNKYQHQIVDFSWKIKYFCLFISLWYSLTWQNVKHTQYYTKLNLKTREEFSFK